MKSFDATGPKLSRLIARLSPDRKKLLRQKFRLTDRITPHRIENALQPLSFSQQQLWFLDRLYPGSATYNIARAYRFNGKLSVEALEKAFELLVQRHEAFRTCFVSYHGEAKQKIMPDFDLPFTLVHVEPGTDRQIASRTAQYFKECGEQAFDLSQGPLFRVQLLCIRPREHILILAMHHIITDGWSINLFLSELSTLYRAGCMGQPSPLEPLAIQYVDYTYWQQQQIRAGKLDRKLAYWQSRLEGAQLLELPSDRDYPRVQNFEGARRFHKLPAKLGEQLKSLGQVEGATMFMVFLAAFKMLLHRYRGQQEIVLATPFAGRTMPELECLIGYFVNVLVLRTDLSGNPGFTELLRRVREVMLGALDNQDFPFAKLVENLHPERHGAANPYFNVMVNFRAGLDKIGDFGDVAVKRVDTGIARSKFPLELHITPASNGVYLRLDYQTSLFNADRIDSILHQYGYLLEQIASNPAKAICSYSLLDIRSRELLPDPLKRLEEPLYKSVPELFSVCVRQYPESAAVIQGAETWTYTELNIASEHIAQLLYQRGISTGQTVAVTGERCFGLIVAMLGVLKSGGVLLLLDPTLPAKRCEMMIQGAKVVQQIFVGSVPRPADVADMNKPPLKLVPENGLPLDALHLEQKQWVDLPVPEPDSAAYIFFTSGTTGSPKGVRGTHKGLGHFLSWQRKQFAIGSQDRVAQLTGLSFDMILRDVFLPLSCGAELCLPSPDVASVFSWLQRQAVTVLHTVPSVSQSWLLDAPQEVLLPDLRLLFFAGEALSDTLAEEWRARLRNNCTLINLYGPTEATMVKCFHVLEKPVQPGIQPLGHTLPQAQALIVNRLGDLAGVSEMGEIVLRSPFGTLGYVAESASDSGFRVNPFREDMLDTVYFTGDRGCYRPDGSLDFLGRWDDQVKIHGIRVELEEIRVALSKHPKIKQAVVVVREEQPDEKCLVAYIVLAEGDLPTIESLRSALSEYLPEALIPEVFVPLEAMPLTPNGKLDRGALPAPELNRLMLGSRYEAPRTPVEESLVEMWQEILMLDSQPGIHDNFFALGGHSLLSAHMVVQIEEAFGKSIPLQQFFSHPTIADLSRLLDGAEKSVSSMELKSETTQATGPWLLVPRLREKLLSYVGSWKGERLEPDSLVIGHNTLGKDVPLFWVLQAQHELLQLARYLGEKQPVYGMRSGSAIMTYQETEIQTLALGYVEEIIALRPAGPLLIGGNCQGGIIALAIAQHLLRRRRQVVMLTLMEWSYPPQPYGGSVTLLFGRDSRFNPYIRYRNPELAWRRAFQDYHVELISGAHGQFFQEPNIQSLTSTLKRCFADAYNKAPLLLPHGSKKVRLRVIDPPVTLPVSSCYELTVEVRNLSNVCWDRGEKTGLMLGNEWYARDGRLISQLDGRVPLPRLAPGESGVVELSVVTPSQPGQVRLSVELMEEGVRRYESEAGTVAMMVNLTA